jgi:anti-sigma28 factor (negative regulator of flagellin synthesis)
MGTIKDIIHLSPDINRLNKNQEPKKIKQDKVDAKEQSSESKEPSRDKAQISSAARELLNLKMEAADYLDKVKNAETISEGEVEQIKSKIANKYFTDPEVIDAIVDKLLSMSNFLNKT